ncbi:MAG: bifunctional nuclease family protein, partial [bacterium]|nr:bifunctional nuclease family protein [bacterium]
MEGSHMILVEVATLALDARGEPVVILRPVGAGEQKLLPIWIGVQEANAIMLSVEQMTAERPMSYDLMSKLLDETGASVTQVAVTRLEGGTFYAVISLQTAEGERSVDARPSDSIALAARTGAPIYVAAEVLEEAGVTGVIEEDSEGDSEEGEVPEEEIEEF